MRYWFYTSHKLGPDGENVNHLGLARTPVLWTIWQDVCEWVCSKIFRDRWCHVIAFPATFGAHKRTEWFDEVSVSDEWVERYHAWRGWSRPLWLDEDDDA